MPIMFYFVLNNVFDKFETLCIRQNSKARFISLLLFFILYANTQPANSMVMYDGNMRSRN